MLRVPAVLTTQPAQLTPAPPRIQGLSPTQGACGNDCDDASGASGFDDAARPSYTVASQDSGTVPETGGLTSTARLNGCSGRLFVAICVDVFFFQNHFVSHFLWDRPSQRGWKVASQHASEITSKIAGAESERRLAVFFPPFHHPSPSHPYRLE